MSTFNLNDLLAALSPDSGDSVDPVLHRVATLFRPPAFDSWLAVILFTYFSFRFPKHWFAL